jgi:hypothetical protein
MSEVISVNNVVICKPFPAVVKDQGKAVKGKVEILKKDMKLTGLEVLVSANIQSNDYEAIIPVGKTVYVRSDRSTHPWATKCTAPFLKTAEGTDVEFILVPFSEVVACD